MSRNIGIMLVVVLLVATVGATMVYGERGGRRGHFGAQLTEEQREAVHAKIKEMREAGASREEIHQAVRETLEGYGISLSEGALERGGRRGHFGAQLTEEQREAVHAKVREMREAGASREEIHQAVREMVAGFGIDLPDCKEAPSVRNLGENPGRRVKWGEIKGEFE
jgi:DNA-binding transcriptional regulator YhcF (GntR family)